MPALAPITRKTRSQVYALPAPTGGWNARDALSDMEEEDAIILDNFFPAVGAVEVRKGYAAHQTAGSSDVETIAEYHSGTARQMIAASGTTVYDASGTPSSLRTGRANARWQTANFNGYMFLANGADTPQIYDGTTMSDSGFSGTTTSEFVGVNAFKNRLWFWKSTSQSVWYGGVNAITSTVTEFPLSRVGNFGGALACMATWTRDAGDGQDDLAVFIMTSGEVLVYQGTDPSDADLWSLVGVFRIGEPVGGPRCALKFGADVIVLTKRGAVNLGSVLPQAQSTQKPISDKINAALSSVAMTQASAFGWQAIEYPLGRWLLLNVPTGSNEFHQYVANLQTGAWCRFKDISARCWGLYQNRLYFGTASGLIRRADDGYSDVGAAITAEAKTAFTAAKKEGAMKRWHAARIQLASSSHIAGGIVVTADYAPGSTPTIASSAFKIASSSGSAWNTSAWNTSPWASADLSIADIYRASSAQGRRASLRLRVQQDEHPVTWLGYDLMFERGGYN